MSLRWHQKFIEDHRCSGLQQVFVFNTQLFCHSQVMCTPYSCTHLRPKQKGICILIGGAALCPQTRRAWVQSPPLALHACQFSLPTLLPHHSP